MLRQAVAFCFVTIFLQPVVWAQQTLPTDDANASASENAGPASVEERASDRQSWLPPGLDRFYAGATVGPVFLRDNSVGAVDLDYDVGSEITALAGVGFGKLRAEVEFASQFAEFDPSISRFKGDLHVFRATAGFYLDIVTIDFDWVRGVTPYVGAGAGIAVADIESFDDDDTGFTAHGEVGFSFPVHSRIDVFPAYRLEWADFDTLDDDHVAHVVRAGARYNF
ncbi:MAG: outer membrane protein [Geminicoccaceae bacterium]